MHFLQGTKKFYNILYIYKDMLYFSLDVYFFRIPKKKYIFRIPKLQQDHIVYK